MKVFTSHLKPGKQPVLVREGFSWGAAVFGWIWLLFQQAWIPAALVFAAGLVLGRLATAPAAIGLGFGLFLIQGLFGRDWVRWSLARRGYVQGPPVTAASHDAALARLLTERADLLPGLTVAAL